MAMVASLLLGIAALAWLVAALSGLELVLRHPAEDRTFRWYALNGYAWFSAGNFAASGETTHKRMLSGMAGFLLFVALGIGTVALTSP